MLLERLSKGEERTRRGTVVSEAPVLALAASAHASASNIANDGAQQQRRPLPAVRCALASSAERESVRGRALGWCSDASRAGGSGRANN
eukprot:6176550-Pleurochrysis_carterae.AAC.1